MDERGLELLNSRCRALGVLLPLCAVLNLAVQWGSAAGLIVSAPFTTVRLIMPVFGLLFGLCFLASMILTAIWLHRASTNLREAGFAMQYSPHSAWAWHLVPILNLYKPYQAMKEIWNASHCLRISFDDKEDALLESCWTFWMFSWACLYITILFGPINVTYMGLPANWIFEIWPSVTAFILLHVVQNVTAAQHALMRNSVFD